MLPAAFEGEHRWLSEIDFDPVGAWLRMGTRNLGSRPWLVADQKRAAELELKRTLLHERFDEVFAAEAGAVDAGRETLELIEAALRSLPDGVARSGQARDIDGELHPLDRAGRLMQEDLCLLRPGPDGTWVLAGASLCFPSRWRLATKMGRGLNAVHAPVPGYEASLNNRVDSLMTRLAENPEPKVAWRRNWFIHPDGALFQPDRPAADPVVAAGHCLSNLHLRSERQTLRALPATRWVVFAIRTQQATLAEVVGQPGLREQLGRYLADADAALVEHRGVGAEQRRQLLAALG